MSKIASVSVVCVLQMQLLEASAESGMASQCGMIAHPNEATQRGSRPSVSANRG